MGQAKRRRLALGALYGTPEAANHTTGRLDTRTQVRLRRLGLLAAGRLEEGDPLYYWISLELRRIAGVLDEDTLTRACHVVSASMGLMGKQMEEVEDIIWVNAVPERTLEDLSERLNAEIAQYKLDPVLYQPSGL